MPVRDRGYPTPDAPSEITITSRCVPIPNIPEFIALIGGLLSQATLPEFWQEIGEMTPQQCAELMADTLALYDASTEGECNVADGTPVGAIVWFPFASIPDKWLKCLGGTFDAEIYPELAALLGSTTLPSLGQRFLFGADSDDDLFDVTGQQSITIIETNLPPHAHSVPSNTHTILASDGVGALTNRVVKGNNTNTINSTAINAAAATVTGNGNGTSEPINTMPPCVMGYWIMKALP